MKGFQVLPKRTILLDCIIIFALAKIMLVFEWSQVVNNGLPFVFSVMRGDSWWFKNIVEHGYMQQVLTNDPIRMGQANWAFFPFFPLLVKLVSLVGFTSDIAAIVVNQIQLFLALIVSYLLALQLFEQNRLAAMCVPLLIAMSPANIWFMAAYSDMTYLFISIVAFYCLHHDRLWWFTLCGFLLAFTRFTGFLLILPLVVYYLRQHKFSKSERFKLVLQSLFILCGLVVFMLVLYVVMGDPLAFYHIQSAWGHLGTSWFTSPWQSLISTWGSGVGHDRLFVILVPFWLAILIWQRYYEEAIYGFFCMLAPIAAGSLWSYSRYALGMYPFYLACGLIARKNYLLGLGILLIAVFISASYWTVWLNDGWV